MRFFILCAASALALYVIAQEDAPHPVKSDAKRIAVKAKQKSRSIHSSKSRSAKRKTKS